VAGEPLVGRLRQAGACRLVADARVARVSQRRAVAREPTAAHPPRARLAHGAEGVAVGVRDAGGLGPHGGRPEQSRREEETPDDPWPHPAAPSPTPPGRHASHLGCSIPRYARSHRAPFRLRTSHRSVTQEQRRICQGKVYSVAGPYNEPLEKFHPYCDASWTTPPDAHRPSSEAPIAPTQRIRGVQGSTLDAKASAQSSSGRRTGSGRWVSRHAASSGGWRTAAAVRDGRSGGLS